MKLSELFGKRVVTTAGREGYVLKAVYSGGRIVRLVCADLNEREFNVSAAGIKKAGAGLLCRPASGKSQGKILRLGLLCYDKFGGFLGILQDATIFGDKIKSAKIGKKNYPFSGLSIGDAVIVYSADTATLERAIEDGEYVKTRLKGL